MPHLLTRRDILGRYYSVGNFRSFGFLFILPFGQKFGSPVFYFFSLPDSVLWTSSVSTLWTSSVMFIEIVVNTTISMVMLNMFEWHPAASCEGRHCNKQTPLNLPFKFCAFFRKGVNRLLWKRVPAYIFSRIYRTWSVLFCGIL